MQLPGIIKLEDMFRKQTTEDSSDSKQEKNTCPNSPENTSMGAPPKINKEGVDLFKQKVAEAIAPTFIEFGKEKAAEKHIYEYNDPNVIVDVFCAENFQRHASTDDYKSKIFDLDGAILRMEKGYDCHRLAYNG